MNAKLSGHLIVATLFALTLVCPGYGQQRSGVDMRSKIPLPSGVKKGVLSSGLTYYIARDNEKRNEVYLKLVVKAGFNNQEKDQTEVAHILEHVLFARNQRFSSAGINAATAKEYTEYWFKTSADSIKYVFSDINDWLYKKVELRDSDIVSEKKIVAEENRSRGRSNAAESRMLNRLSRTSSSSSITIGYLDKVSIEAIKSYYEKWYRPEISSVVVVGDVDIQKVEASMKDMFGSKNSGHAKPVATKDYSNANVDARQPYIVELYPETYGKKVDVSFFFWQPLKYVKTYGDYKQSLISRICDDIINLRIHDLYRDDSDYPFRSIVAGYKSDFHGVRGFQIHSSVTDPRSLQFTMTTMFLELERIRQYGCSEQELMVSKKQMADYIKNDARISVFDWLSALRNEFVFGEMNLIDGKLKRDLLEGISLQDVNDLFKGWVTNYTMDIAILAPESAKQDIPTMSQIEGWFGAIKGKTLSAYKKKDEVVKKVNFDSVYTLSSKIDFKSREIEGVGITEIDFSNGIKVLVKDPGQQKAEDVVSFKLSKPIGTLSYRGDDFYSAKVALDVVLNTGVGELKRGELTGYLQKHNIEIRSYMESQEMGLIGQFPKAEMETFLQVLYRYFLPPRVDSVNYSKMMGRFIDASEGSERDCRSKTLSRLLGYTVEIQRDLSYDEIRHITYKRCLDIYKTCFSDAGGATLAFAGLSVDPMVTGLLGRYLGSIRRGDVNYGRSMVKLKPRSAPVDTVVVSDKMKVMRADVFMYYVFDHVDDEKSIVSFKVLAEILGDVLMKRIREREAGTYSLGSQLQILKSTDHDKSVFQLRVAFSCDPALREHLVRAALEEIEMLTAKGPDEATFRKALDVYKTYNTISAFNNMRWCYYLTSPANIRSQFSSINKSQEIINSITVEGLKEAAKLIFRPNQFIQYAEEPKASKF